MPLLTITGDQDQSAAAADTAHAAAAEAAIPAEASTSKAAASAEAALRRRDPLAGTPHTRGPRLAAEGTNFNPIVTNCCRDCPQYFEGEGQYILKSYKSVGSTPIQDGDENGIGKNGNVNNAFGFNFVQQGELNYNEAGLRPRPPRPPPLRKRPQIPERKPVLFPAEIPGNGNIPGKGKPFPGKGQVNGDVNKNNNNDNDDFDLLVHTYFPDVESRPLPGMNFFQSF